MRHIKRRRILVLTPRDPYPVMGGDRLRIYRLARELSRYHDLTLLTLCSTEQQRSAPLPADGVFTSVHRVLLPAWRSYLNVLAALPTRQPLQVAYYKSAAYRAAVRFLAPSHDVVLAHLVRTAQYASDVHSTRILEMTDAISMSMERIAQTKLGYFDWRRLVYAVEAGRLAAHERQIAGDFNLVTFNSAVDRSFLFGPEADRRVMVVPNGVDAPEAMPPPLCERSRDEIAFVGNLHSLQNFDAAWFFARRVLPLVRARHPGAYLRIVGPVPRSAERELAGIPGVRVQGPVPSLEPALATARVGVCAARLNAGMQNKLLDYFANRLAVVSSPIGLEGLDAQPGEHLLLADAPHEWADQVLRLMEDDALAQRLADSGRMLACQQYRWDLCVLPLLTRLESLLDPQSRIEKSADAPTVSQGPAPWPVLHAPASRSSAT